MNREGFLFITVQALQQALGLRVFHLADGGREVSRGYVGDLLSWVLGRAEAGSAWLTIMSNQNVAAVALLTEAACVILTEGVEPDPDLLRRAEEKGVNLLGDGGDSFSVALRIGGVL